MKTLKIMLLALLCISYQNAVSQKKNIKWSAPFEDKDPDRPDKVLYDDGDNLYLQVTNEEGKSKGISPGILQVNGELKKVKSEFYSATEDDVNFHGFFYVANQFVMVTSFRDKAEKTREVKAYTIDKQTLKIKQGVSLMKIPSPKSGDMGFTVLLSPDTTKFVIFTMADVKKSEPDMVTYKVFDGNLKVINENDVTLEKTSELTIVHEITLSNEGDVFAFVKVYDESSKNETVKNAQKVKIASYQYYMMRYAKNKDVKKTKVELGENLIGDVATCFDPASNELCIAAQWYNAADEDLVGYKYFRIDPIKVTVAKAEVNMFTEAMMTEARDCDKGGSSTKKGISSDYRITDFNILPDGRTFMVWERNWSQITGSGSMTRGGYYSESLIAFMLDHDGKAKWNHVMCKAQVFFDMDTYLYHSVAYSKTGISILYDDKEQSVNAVIPKKKPSGTPFNAIKEMSLVNATITNEGKLDWRVMANTADLGTNVILYKSRQTTSNHFIFYGFTIKGMAMAGHRLKGDVKLGKYTLDSK